MANHAGNIAAAALSGWLGAWLGMPYIFALSAAFGAGCILTALWIPPGSVHRHYARGFAKDDADDASDIHPDALRVLLHNRSLLVLSAALAAFNLGNSAMLPLYSLAVASTHAADPSHVTAANIVISQIVMLIAAAYASRAIRRFGFWWIILATLDAAAARRHGGVRPADVGRPAGAGVRRPRRGISERRGARARRASAAWERPRDLGQGAVLGVEVAGACFSPMLGGWIAHQYGFSAAFVALGSLSVISFAIWVGYGRRVREACDTRRDELGKLSDVDSSTLVP
ncbi:MFS transporter [Caballeronia sp. LZ065]|uniref:MFS transporter n=1 Tax=Caballeronia sp. LZ065 TaxID=3038571 RepID=UPI00286CC527|nr:MFS transporter [Caballeronia sp. LZ065]